MKRLWLLPLILLVFASCNKDQEKKKMNVLKEIDQDEMSLFMEEKEMFRNSMMHKRDILMRLLGKTRFASRAETISQTLMNDPYLEKRKDIRTQVWKVKEKMYEMLQEGEDPQKVKAKWDSEFQRLRKKITPDIQAMEEQSRELEDFMMNIEENNEAGEIRHPGDVPPPPEDPVE